MAELLILAVPLSIFGKKIFGAWVYDFVLAFSLGIASQFAMFCGFATSYPVNWLLLKRGVKEAM